MSDQRQHHLDLVTVLQDIYEAEGNVSIVSFWDGGWDVKIGDVWNGFDAEHTFRPEEFDEGVAVWLARAFADLHPGSAFAEKYGIR